jgi:hypothetical protein
LRKLQLWLSLSGIFVATEARAYEVSTHRLLTARALDAVGPELDGLISDAIEENFELDSALLSKSMRDWILDGSEEEDDGFRPLHHFHDPLQSPAEEAGLSLDGTSIDFRSAAVWALSPAGVQRSALPFTGNDPHYSLSWYDAREHYYLALTAPDRQFRERNLIAVARAVGAVMHLIQDSSAPSHVRNDAHFPGVNILGATIADDSDDFHFWCERRNDLIGQLADQPIFADEELMWTEHPDLVLPIANLFDYDRYTGGAPSETTEPFAHSPRTGLSEFANANFFSEDTVFIDLGPVYLQPPLFGLRPLGAQEFPRPVFYALDRLDEGSPRSLVEPVILQTVYPLPLYTLANDAVHQAYATRLIPRATGYSSEVPMYFFRGGVEVEAVSSTEIRLINTGDELIDGTFRFFYDDEQGLRTELDTMDLIIYPRSESMIISLDVPEDAVRQIVVFRGDRGLELEESVFAIAGDWFGDRCDPCYFSIATERGGGYVELSEPPSICTSGGCENSYSWGTHVQILAVPDPGFHFEQWSNDCEELFSNPTTVVVDDHLYCGAGFGCDAPYTMCSISGEEEELWQCVLDTCTDGHELDTDTCECVCPEDQIECGGVCLSLQCATGECFDTRSCACTTPPGPYEECYVETDYYAGRDLCDGTTDVHGYRIGIYQYRNGVSGDYCLGPTTQIILGSQDPTWPNGWGPLHGFDTTVSPADPVEPLECFPYAIDCTSGDLCIGAIFYESIIPFFEMEFTAPGTTTRVQLSASACL